MKNTLKGINSRLDEAENWISILKDKVVENTQSEQQQKTKTKQKQLKEDILRGLARTPRVPTFTSQGYQKEKNEKKELKPYLKE